ncbi:PepSY domain-containing protein [Nitrincola iocasae]|uniref:PepSY domain-containing protein n=1 Tax=Nitrincola iocasae TaxID=2614693 RepID=A0A5J6LE33_9GAMM|nr:PepSY domain-containing protein [Nitrincola iocasae]QEW06638.1 PepSY domain-containing protein [Nitrincola iocasae]
MNTKPIVLGLSILLLSGASLADDDCDDPISHWQPQETLRQQLEADGWTVFRIKVDDGCYEVKANDANGNRVEASFAPASFDLMELEREDDDDDDDHDDDEYRSNNQTPAANPVMPSNGIVKGRPSVTVE